MVSMVSKFSLHTFPTCGLYEGPERSEVLLTDAPGRQAHCTSLAKNKNNNKHNNDPWQQGKYFHGHSLARNMT